ncbi:MAG: hypothetical protein IJI36_04660 [Kiritimatiellae bacterium]|nr:hypothetical protein [Kiritimatiellia bacterium]
MISDSDKRRIKQIVDGISRRPSVSGPSPHKDVFLLALLDAFEGTASHTNRFPLTNSLDLAFKNEWERHVGNPYLTTAIELPFWYLQNDGIWFLKVKDGMESRVRAFSRATRKRIIECIDYGYFSEEVYRFVSDESGRLFLRNCLERRLSDVIVHQEDMSDMNHCNPFVSYLNSLQNTDANSDGAMAESQVKNPQFSEIFVPHPLAERLCASLLAEDGGHVILTGHAGDGKSILAHEVVKKLRGDASASAGDGFPRRIEVEHGGLLVVIVKDMSEWTTAENDALIDELIGADVRHKRFLLVSNTGRLLPFFCDRCNRVGATCSRAAIEDALLTAFDASQEKRFSFGPAKFSVWNLARQDNVGLGMQMFKRMIDAEKWNDCSHCEHAEKCPLLDNRNILLRHFDMVSKRIEWLYRRAYSYGGRLTMRQLGAHFAYSITGGRSCADICRAMESGRRIRQELFLFSNLFWGDDGERDDPRAVQQLKAVALMREQDFNTCYSPAQEREFWGKGEGFLSRTDACLSEMELRLLKTETVREDSDLRKAVELREARRRRNYRRMVYFLGTPRPDFCMDGTFRKFQSAFLNSPTLLDVLSWKADESRFRPHALMMPLFRVLQEEFCGIRPREGASDMGPLYITLNRRSYGTRQSVQLVMAKCDFRRCFSIVLAPENPVALLLKGENELVGIDMEIPVPFLDYIYERSTGVLGRGLQCSYRNRIEVLKSEILRILHGSASRDSSTLALLQRKADGSFSLPQIQVSGIGEARRLEVLQ